jgi:hypothetical protein
MENREAGSWEVRSLWGLQSVPFVVCIMLFLSGGATSQGETQTQSARFEFALIGDVPYDARQEREFANVMKEIDAAELAFVVHNDDFWWDGAASRLGVIPRAVTRLSSIVWVWRKVPSTPSYLLPETTSGPTAIGQSHARMIRSRD